MPRTYFHNFARDDGSPVTVEYSMEGSYSPTTYSPINGAVGGDAPEFSIVGCWPNTPEFDALVRRRTDMTHYLGKPTPLALMQTQATAEELRDLNRQIEAAEAACVPTDAERERFEAYLAEHYFELHGDDDTEPTF